jgi:hypothetical protein
MSEELGDPKKFYELVHPGGMRGLLLKKPRMRKQDSKFKPGEFYAVVFFPKITRIGSATAAWPSTIETLARSPEAAIVKFMDRIKQGESWETYHDAGHRGRRVKITDLGDP